MLVCFLAQVSFGENPQNYLTYTLVLVSDRMDFHINYDLEACAYRSISAHQAGICQGVNYLQLSPKALES